tara:strand:- start:22417 stop:22839 length:423 start_codon:yes stop_codon:yes gene_type:complete
MKHIGIWIDKKNAKVVTFTKDGETLETVLSEVEFFNRKGSSRPRLKTGMAQDVVHESMYLEREKQQLKAYFKKLAAITKDADTIAIFGPASTPEKFRKELQEHYKPIGEKVKIVKKTDSMTDNQVIALVRDYFSHNKIIM